MTHACWALAASFVLAMSATAQDASDSDGEAGAQSFDVLQEVGGVWAYDLRDVEAPGDFTCATRPIAITVVDGGARVASMRPGDDAERYGLVLDVRNDFPLGPALSIVWEDAAPDEDGAPVATILYMENTETFAWVQGPSLQAYLDGVGDLERTARRSRCATEVEQADASDVIGDGVSAGDEPAE